MPLIQVTLYDTRLESTEAAGKIIEKMTDALVDATGDEGVRRHTTVLVNGIPAAHWGVAGKPTG